MTHPVIAGGLAAQLDRLADIVKRNWTWPSPAAGFASWLFRRLGTPAFFAHPTAKSTPDLLRRLGEAPVLAAYGYALASGDEPDPALVEAWAAGVQRLAGRDPLPGDRQSFFFRPVELLGLALGAAAVAAQEPHPGRWLRKVLGEGMPRVGTDTWSVALTTYASAALGSPAAMGRVAVVAEATAVDLAVLWLLASEASDAAILVGLDQTRDEIESHLLHRLALTAAPHPEVAEAATLYVAAASAIRTGLAHAGAGRQAALTTITGVLRRFPAIVRELGVRHARRTPLVEIKDEYDVQDLLRGVLRGLFDDVRDEEYTPSHAGLTSRMDLLLKREQIVIETKMTRANLDQRGVTEELAIDKELYRSHPDCRTLVCFVYDPDRRLGNPAGLENDLTDLHSPMPTIVIVAPLD